MRWLLAFLVAQAAAPRGGSYTLPPLTSTTLGGVKGTGAATTCSGTDKATGFNASGTLQCAADQTGSTSPGGLSGNLQTNNGAGAFGAYVGASCAYAVKSLDASGASTCTAAPTIPADISGAHYVTTQAEANLSAEAVLPTCTGTDKLTFNGTTISCATDQTSAGGGAPSTATYITQTHDATLSAEQALADLATGIVKNTTTTGVLSIATAGTDYSLGTGANGTGLVLSTTTTGALSAYGGTSCTNQFPRSLNASGAATCGSVALADFVANLGTTTTLLHGNAAGQPSYGGVALADFTANQGTTTTLLHGNAAGQPTFAGVGLADFTANLGTTTTVLHGNGAGQPTYGSVVSGDISGPLTEAVGGTGAAALTCTNQFVTSNGTAYSCSTDTLAGAQHANQGTTTTLLHGNGAGNPSWAGVSLANDTAANQGTTTTVLHGNAAGQPSFASIVGADLPNPSASTLGGVQSLAVVASKWINTISTSGVPSATQPAITDITGAPVKTFVTSDVNITSATASIITGLTLTVAAATSYGFSCNIVETNTTTSAMRYAVSTPASPTTVSAMVTHFTTVLTSAVTEGLTGAWATTCTNCTAAVTTSVSATTHLTELNGVVLNGANTGSIQIFAAASTAAQANIVKKGSYCEWWTP